VLMLVLRLLDLLLVHAAIVKRYADRASRLCPTCGDRGSRMPDRWQKTLEICPCRQIRVER
jgi:hypothetical protein